MGIHDIQLVALDMDGTLLTSNKQILKETVQAIKKAEEEGIRVVLATGRALAEIEDYREALIPISYAITESGGLLYDFKRNHVLWKHSFDACMRERIIRSSFLEDVMLQTMESGDVVMQEGCLEQLPRYHIEHFSDLFRRVCKMVPDIRKYILCQDRQIEKINLYHLNHSARERTIETLRNTELELVRSDFSSLEISPPNVSKGNALLQLCSLIRIPIGHTAAVGDSDNDLSMLQAAGFAVAMGNANEQIKGIAHFVTKDCDHNGVGLFLNGILKS